LVRHQKRHWPAGDHRGGFHFANFVTLILMISFGFAMVNYYDAPIPGFGRDFHHLITDEAATLSNQIGQANAQRIADDTQYVLGNLEAPGITQPIATFPTRCCGCSSRDEGLA